MQIHDDSLNETALTTFQTKKILTINELSDLLHCSAITCRRRLKQWETLTSYNQNNRYYTLPAIPRFNKKGLWRYKGVFFSKHGTCKQTVIHFVQISEKGLSNTELAEVLGENPNSLLAHFGKIPGITKERHGRDIVYFCSEEEVYKRQQRKRFPPEPPLLQLPSDALRIVILVEVIKYPGRSITELAKGLAKSGQAIDEPMIHSLFDFYGLKKND